jgi:hypothetical protein
LTFLATSKKELYNSALPNLEGAQVEDTRLDLPTMWTDSPDVHQDEMGALVFKQRGTSLEVL